MTRNFPKLLSLSLSIILWMGWMLALPIRAAAQLDIINPGSSEENPDGFGLGEIQIPTFLSLDQVQNFSLLSYAGVLITLVFVAVLLLWVYLVLRGAVDVIRSQGEEGMIEGGKKRISNVLISISVLFVFLVGITLVGSFFGVGNFWEWPKSFSLCTDSDNYFFRYVLENADSGKTSAQLEAECFGKGVGTGNKK